MQRTSVGGPPGGAPGVAGVRAEYDHGFASSDQALELWELVTVEDPAATTAGKLVATTLDKARVRELGRTLNPNVTPVRTRGPFTAGDLLSRIRAGRRNPAANPVSVVLLYVAGPGGYELLDATVYEDEEEAGTAAAALRENPGPAARSAGGWLVEVVDARLVSKQATPPGPGQ